MRKATVAIAKDLRIYIFFFSLASSSLLFEYVYHMQNLIFHLFARGKYKFVCFLLFRALSQFRFLFEMTLELIAGFFFFLHFAVFSVVPYLAECRSHVYHHGGEEWRKNNTEIGKYFCIKFTFMAIVCAFFFSTNSMAFLFGILLSPFSIPVLQNTIERGIVFFSLLYSAFFVTFSNIFS